MFTCKGPCQELKELGDFYICRSGKNRKQYRKLWCKKCENERRSKYKTAADNNKQLDVIIKLADEATACDICGAANSHIGRGRLCIDFTPVGFKHRGYLCNVCNRVIGLFHSDPKRFKKAATYLTKGKK